MLHKRLIYLLMFFSLLTGCLGGGGGSGEESTVNEQVVTLSLFITNNFQPADGNSSIEFTAVARDENNSPISDAEIYLSSESNFAKFSQFSGTTDEQGRFDTNISNTYAESFNIIATIGILQSEAINVTFITPTNQIILQANTEVLKTEDQTEVTITIYQETEILPNAEFNIAVSGSAQVENLPTKTDANGQATFTISNHIAEEVVITAISGEIKQTLSLFFGAKLELLLPNSVNATDEVELIALLKDANNKPLAGQTVSFNFVSGVNKTLSPSSAVTAEDGTVKVKITDLARDNGFAIIRATSGSLSASTTVIFALISGNWQFNVETSATVLEVSQSANITVKVAYNNSSLVVGQTIEFYLSETDNNAQLSTTTGVTDAEGELSTSVSTMQGENVTVIIETNDAKQEIPLYFGSKLRFNSNEKSAASNQAIELTAIISDTHGVGIVGIPINLRITAGHAFLSDFRVISDELGRATFEVNADLPGEVMVEAQADYLDIATAKLNFSATEATKITLTTNIKESLSLNGDASIFATVRDAQGYLVEDGTLVNFNSNIGVIEEVALTQAGQAEVTFSATTEAGLARITATAGNITEDLLLNIQSGNAGVIELNEIVPPIIGIQGSGIEQSATIEFLIKDNLGNLVSDDTVVEFSLGTTKLGGGEKIATAGSGGNSATAKTNNGIVSVTLQSGIVAGTIDVIATVGEISTVARVTIVSGMPDAKHFSLAAEYLNIAGGVRFGLHDKITAYLGDRFGNIVPDNTPVSFITEGGTIGQSVGGGVFTATSTFGQATAILQSAAPTTPFLGGVPALQYFGYECSGNYASVLESTATDLCGNPGLVTVVAFTTGSESFVDANGNGYFDAGENFNDLTEPYIDANDSGKFDAGELYIDVSGDGQFNAGNGKFDGPGGESQNTTIWTSIRILFSDNTPNPISVTPISFSIPNFESQTFVVENISDIYGNALVSGSRFQVTTTGGKLGGTTNLILEDSNRRGMSSITFTLASNPCDKDGCPPPEAVTLMVKVISSSQEQAPGGNGNVELSISGMINN